MQYLNVFKLVLAMLLVIGMISSSIAQETFQLLFKNPNDERAQSMIENSNHEMLAVGSVGESFFGLMGKEGKIWKFKNQYDTLTRTYLFHDTACYFSNIMQLSNGNYHVFSIMYEPPLYNIYSLTMLELNEQLNIIGQKRLEIGARHLVSCFVKDFHDKYYLLGTGYWGDTLKTYAVRLDKSLNVCAFKSFTDPAAGDGYFMDCILSPDSTQLWTISSFPHDGNGSHMIVFDTALNLIKVKPLPEYMNLNAGIFEGYQHNITIKNLTGDKFVTGSIMEKMVNWDNHNKIGFSVLDTSMQWPVVQYFGSDDTSYYTTYARPTFDFRSPDSIFFTGIKRQISAFFPQQPSWIMAGALDSTFQPYYLNYYGGDAYYHAHSMLLTSDGGFIILADRYDKNTQDQEYDVFFLKLNNEGLITSAGNNDICPQQPYLIYPNPFENNFQIELFDEQAFLQITNIDGKGIYESKLSGGITKVDLSPYKTGVYPVKITLKNGKTFSTKVIKIK